MVGLLDEINRNYKEKCGIEKHTTSILSLQLGIAKLYPNQIYNIHINGVNSSGEYPNLSEYNTSAPSEEDFNAYAESLISLQSSLGAASINSVSIQR